MTRLILNSFKFNQHTFSHLLFVLVYIRTMHHELYEKVERNALSLQELSDAIFDLMPPEIKNKYGLNLVYVVALLLHFYNNNQDYQKKVELLEKDEEGNTIIPKINFDTIDGKELSRSFEYINQQSSYRDTSLRFLTNKISLTETIIVN